MSAVLALLWQVLRDALLMAWEVWWALVFGFFISAVVQSWVPRRRIERALAGGGPRSVLTATGLGAASSSCSYAAVAIAKSLFQKGASASSALAFQFASTNLVWELGLVLWVLIGWQFTVAEYLGGLVMIGLMAVLIRAFIPAGLERQAREHAQRADTGHQHHMSGGSMGVRARLTSAAAWSDVAHNFRGDWQMLWREITAGFLLAGLVAQLGDGFLGSLFLRGAPSFWRAVWGAVLGPVIAVLSFVCSVGNVPLAAVLWSGGISFAGVIAFIFADLIVLPILLIYRKYYGSAFALRAGGLMLLTMILAALLIATVFAGLGLLPTGARPARSAIFGSVEWGAKTVLNALALVGFAGLVALTTRRGARDPVCGMQVDRTRALRATVGGRTRYFCSEGCLGRFQDEVEGGAPAGRVGGGVRAAG